MAAPVIGITSSIVPPKDGKFGTLTLGESYIQAVANAGGIPLVIPPVLQGSGPENLEALLSRLDGILFTGGSDIDPARFNGRPHPRVYGIEETRDSVEIRLVQMASERGKPFLGICRGIQVINVALGGTLFTDISDQKDQALKHDYFPDVPRNYLAHPVRVSSDSALSSVLGGESFEVNSLHHQGIEQVAEVLRPVAYAPDQLVEAVELTGHPFGLGVQWHPEWLQEHEPQRRLFCALIHASNGKS